MLLTIVSQLSAQPPHPPAQHIKPDYRECCAVIWCEREEELGQTVSSGGFSVFIVKSSNSASGETLQVARGELKLTVIVQRLLLCSGTAN